MLAMPAKLVVQAKIHILVTLATLASWSSRCSESAGIAGALYLPGQAGVHSVVVVNSWQLL